MAEGQIRKDLIKKARKNPTKQEEEEEREGLSPDKADIALDAAFAQMDSQDKAQEQVLADRRGIASGLKDLSKRGALTGDLLKEARQRATAAGVSEGQFSSFMDKEGIKTPAALTESKEEAAQNVMFQRQYGTGLGTLAAMQDTNYELGSGSALRQPARSIGPASGKFRRAARRLRRQGYGKAAEQMAMRGEMARMNEPSIDTPALRGQRMLQKRAVAKEAQKQDKIAAGSKDMFDAMGMEKPKSNDSIQQEPKKARKYRSPLDKTRNGGGLGVTKKGFGATKRQGQRI